MKLKKFVYTSAAALTLFSAGAALTQAQNSTETVQAATTKKKVMHNAYHYEKDGETIVKTSKGKNKMSRSYTTVKVSKKVTINGAKFYKISGKDEYIKAGNIDGTKRKLTHNAYVYTSKGKRKAGVKTLKKGQTVTTYGSSHVVKQNGVKKTMYRIAPGEYIKVANFKKSATPAPEKKPTINTNASSNNTNSSSNSASTAEYQSWLDNRDDGVMVAIRDTDYDAINYGPGHVTKGTTVAIPDDSDEEGGSGADIEKGKDGKIYIVFYGPDDVVYYPAADFTFNAYKKTSEYKNLVQKYVFDNDKYSGAKVTVNGPVYEYGYIDNEKVHDAGDSFVLENAEIILNNKGGYSIVGYEDDGDDGDKVEVPVNYITSYNLIPEEDDE